MVPGKGRDSKVHRLESNPIGSKSGSKAGRRHIPPSSPRPPTSSNTNVWRLGEGTSHFRFYIQYHLRERCPRDIL